MWILLENMHCYAQYYLMYNIMPEIMLEYSTQVYSTLAESLLL